MSGCRFDDCNWQFEEAAERTLVFMRHLYHGMGPGGIQLVEATLSFLGAGIPPPAPSWGQMASEGRGYITSAWWIALFPGAALALVVLAFQLFGDWLRDRLDPKLRQL